MFCFVSGLYWTENKKFVDNIQQCFASGQANSSQNSNVDNILPDLDTNPSIASKIFRALIKID